MLPSNAPPIRRHRWLAFLGTLPYHFIQVKREVIHQNLSIVFGDRLSSQERSHFIRAYFGHMICLGCEVLFHCFTPKWWRRKGVEVKNLHHLKEALAKGKGVLWAGCHLGNWEVALVNLLAHTPELQHQTSVLRKELKPPWLHKLVMGRFQRSGIGVLPTDRSSMRHILKRLKKNESIIFVLDQHASKEAATSVTLFGEQVFLTKSLAKLALRTQAPVLPILTWRKRNGKQVFEFGPPLSSIQGKNEEESVQQTTQAYANVMEQAISAYPEQWFCWVHRLWKASLPYPSEERSSSRIK